MNGNKRTDPEKAPSSSGKKAGKIALIVLIVLLSLVFLGIAVAGGTMIHYYNLMNIETVETLGEGGFMDISDYSDRLNELESYDPGFGSVSYVDAGTLSPDDEQSHLDDEYRLDEDEISRILAGEETEPDIDITDEPSAPDNTMSADTLPEPPETSVPGTSPATPGTTAPSAPTTTKVTPATTKKPADTAPPTPDGNPSTDDKVTNILLIGRDMTGVNGLSDVMIIASVNDTDGTITLTSLLRDTYVYIPANRGSYNRLNAAHSIGGTSLLIATIKRNFGIDIDNYIKVDFNSVQKVFDILGGVNMVLTEQEINHINNRCSDYIDPALAGIEIHLNGLQILSHCRNRYSGNGDWGRTERQRDILTSIFETLKTKSVDELKNLLDQLFPLVTTDISLGDFTSYILKSPTYMKYKINTFTIPGGGYWYYYRDSAGRSVIRISNINKTVALWRKAVYGN